MAKQVKVMDQEDFDKLGIALNTMGEQFKLIAAAQNQFNNAVYKFYESAHQAEGLFLKYLEENNE